MTDETVPSIHDSLLTGYEVDGVNATIVFHTEPFSGGGEAFVDVVFDGVAAYRFENDLLQNIVFDIEEASEAETVAITDRIQAELGRGGFFREWDARKETAMECFIRLNVKAFELGSSYGMTGWVAARGMSQTMSFTPAHVPQPTPAAHDRIQEALAAMAETRSIPKPLGGANVYNRFIPGIQRVLTSGLNAKQMADYLALLHSHALGLPTSAEALEVVAARLVALGAGKNR